MKRLLKRMLDPSEFLSDYGVRSLSRSYADQPYVLRVGDSEYAVKYEPAESSTGLFGGNSNWRGPMGVGRCLAMTSAFEQIQPGGITCSFTSTSMAIPDAVLVPAIRRVGLHSWPSC